MKLQNLFLIFIFSTATFSIFSEDRESVLALLIRSHQRGDMIRTGRKIATSVTFPTTIGSSALVLATTLTTTSFLVSDPTATLLRYGACAIGGSGIAFIVSSCCNAADIGLDAYLDYGSSQIENEALAMPSTSSPSTPPTRTPPNRILHMEPTSSGDCAANRQIR